MAERRLKDGKTKYRANCLVSLVAFAIREHRVDRRDSSRMELK